MNSPKNMARIAGILYLVIFICAGFAQGYVRSGLIAPGDAAATAANILASEGVFRAGFVADLIAFMSDAVVSVLLYLLLKPVSKTLSLIAASFRLLAHPGIASVNLLNHIMVLPVLGGAGYMSAFSPDQLQAFAMLLLDTHRMGYLIAGVFFGVHLLLLGHLLFRSARFHPALGVLIGIAGLGYLAESLGNFLLPGHEGLLAAIVGVSAVAGELSLTLWLLVKGVREESAA